MAVHGTLVIPLEGLDGQQPRNSSSHLHVAQRIIHQVQTNPDGSKLFIDKSRLVREFFWCGLFVLLRKIVEGVPCVVHRYLCSSSIRDVLVRVAYMFMCLESQRMSLAAGRLIAPSVCVTAGRFAVVGRDCRCRLCALYKRLTRIIGSLFIM